MSVEQFDYVYNFWIVVNFRRGIEQRVQVLEDRVVMVEFDFVEVNEKIRELEKRLVKLEK